jgi:phage tail-like protein
MDANGTRYHALVTWRDWEALLPGPPGEHPLAWSSGTGGSGPLARDCGAGGLALKALLYEFKPRTNGPAAAPEQAGRGGVFDAWGNLYALSDDRLAIRLRSVGSGVMSDFWPVTGAVAGAPPRDGIAAVAGWTEGRRTLKPGGFQPVQPVTDPAPLRLDALTVTRGHYLVVAAAATGGLLIFDLHGAGPPLYQSWPGVGKRPAAVIESLTALADGGLGALVDGWLWRLGPDLKPRVAAPPGGHAFDAAPSAPAAAGAPCVLDLRLALGAPTPSELDATQVGAVAALRGERLLVLGRRPVDGHDATVAGIMGHDGTVLALLDGRFSDAVAAAPLDVLLAEVVERDPLTGERARPPLATRVLALDYGLDDGAANSAFTFVVLSAGGDQAFRFAAQWRAEGLAIEVTRDYLPMRHYLGLGLAALPGRAPLAAYPSARLFYAADGRWAPLLALPQPRYLRDATVVTTPWDSAIPACVWHRIALDLRLPPGTGIGIETRAADDPADLARLPWRAEPGPARSPAGSELPWRGTTGAGDAVDGTWGTLLQGAHGRWLQIRITFTGDGKQTPVLRGLRAWFPRFSYARQYLPPVYQGATGGPTTGADFLDRFLALFEGDLTRWEDRIAAAQWLFDARTAPAATLDWLAGWVGVVFDPATDDARRRLLIRHAMTSHARRGTVPGLLLSATLAWESTVDEAWLRAPEDLPKRAHGVRLQEMFGLLPPLPASAWNPATQGRAQLLALLDGNAALTGSGTLLRAFGFTPRGPVEEAQLWTAWVKARDLPDASLPTDEPASAEARSAWGDYLAASAPCAPLRRRWQDFLARRWRRVSALNAAWGTAWRDFARIPTPLAVPATDAALADWHRFEAHVMRALGGAHRFRIVLPLPDAGVELDLDELARRRDAVLRVIATEKPAHTVAEVRFGFDLFRIGEARLGVETRLEAGLARRPELAALGWTGGPFAPAVVGRLDLGGARLAPTRPLPPPDRIGLDRA